MSKRRNRRLRGRALAARAAEANALRQEVKRQATLIRMQDRAIVSARYARDEAAHDFIRRLAESENFNEHVARGYMRRAGEMLGAQLGEAFGKQFQANLPVFEQACKVRDSLLRIAMSGMDIRGSLDARSGKDVYLRADFTIPPLSQSFVVLT